MQGQKGVIGSLPESLALEHGSGSSDSGVVEQQICWNNYMQNPVANTNQENQSVSMWSMGESSSSSLPNQANQNWTDPKTEHEWPLLKACPEPLQLQPPSSTSMLSFGDVNRNITRNHANNGHHGPLFTQSSRPESVPNNVNTSTFIGLKPSNYAGSIAGSSSSEPFELEGRQLPCKRKAVELSVGQSSSGIGSSNVFERPPTNSLMPSDPIIPRLGLGVNGDSSDNNHNVGNTHRNVRIRINTSRQQDPLPASVTAGNTNGQSNVSAPYPSLRLNPVDLRSPPIPMTTENLSSNEGQPILRLPTLRRNLNLPSRWNRSSSSRAHRSLNIAIPGDTSRTLPTNISEHPIFFQPRNTTQTSINWGLNNGGDNVNNNENHIAVASNVVPAPPPSSATSNLVTHRGSPHYSSRRLSEILRRSLLPSLESGAGGGQSGNLFSRSSNRHHDRVFGVPYLARAVAGGSEGRGRLVSEIRNVLDLIRRGEGLRFEDVMILDQSLFHGMADIHDRHRDMRLDIDNMSYEELLALEERIGNVNTGLTEETISGCLKQKTFAAVTDQSDIKPCCICQEEYNDGDELGALECGHDFHTSCIKQWLLQKNSCPVCKSAASAATNGK